MISNISISRQRNRAVFRDRNRLWERYVFGGFGGVRQKQGQGDVPIDPLNIADNELARDTIRIQFPAFGDG